MDGQGGSLIERLSAVVGATGLGFIWFCLLAMWGGTANYLSRIKQSKARFSIMELVGEWAVSAFAGIITAYICLELGFSYFATAALAGVAGHMGGRAIALIEAGLEHWWRKRLGISDEDQTR